MFLENECIASASEKGKRCERSRRSRSQRLLACAGVVELISKSLRACAGAVELLPKSLMCGIRKFPAAVGAGKN